MHALASAPPEDSGEQMDHDISQGNAVTRKQVDIGGSTRPFRTFWRPLCVPERGETLRKLRTHSMPGTTTTRQHQHAVVTAELFCQPEER